MADEPQPAPAAEAHPRPDKPVDGLDAQRRVVIKKYANRRLYNTASSAYVTLEHLSDMVKANVDFVVYDAKTNEDITRSVLTQIIFEQEGRGESLLPVSFLRQLIGLYGDSMQAYVPSYLEMSLAGFAKQQERWREQFGGFGGAPALTQGMALFNEAARQNTAMFENAMKMFSPFGAAKREEPTAPEPQTAPASDLDALKAQMEAMQAQLAKLAEKG